MWESEYVGLFDPTNFDMWGGIFRDFYAKCGTFFPREPHAHVGLLEILDTYVGHLLILVDVWAKIPSKYPQGWRTVVVRL